MAANRYKVPKKQWRKWCEVAQWTFNDLYYAMGDQRIFTHPNTPEVPKKQWETTRWNTAWVAADFAQSNLKNYGSRVK